MKKPNLFAWAVILAAFFSLQALAAPAPKNPQLTPAQTAKINASRKVSRAEMNSQHAQSKVLSDQLRAELKKKPVDQAKVDSLLQQLMAQQEDMQIKQMESMMQQRPNMKAADRQRYKDTLTKMKAHRAKRQPAK